MRLYLVAVGRRVGGWVEEAYQEYARRLPASCELRLIEVAVQKAGKGSDPQWRKAKEGERLLDALPDRVHVVALDEQGKQHSTTELAQRLQHWLTGGRDVAFLIGGADGLSSACRERAEEVWSLSRLTFPHPLVRVIVAEQIYRAWSLLNHHPYHRGE
ncbi:MAG: 23S rRNA (pseudouridine(1915)-N(3))-methyltransferase RlmH [Gammaproteobacteria bacterium]